MNLVLVAGDVASTVYLLISLLAFLGLLGFAVGPELIGAYRESRLVVRHGNRRRQAHRAERPATTGVQVLDELFARAVTR